MPFEASTRHTQFDNELNALIVEASTLGLPTGQWPESIILTSHKTGNRVEFTREQFMRRGDELELVKYHSRHYWLHVLND